MVYTIHLKEIQQRIFDLLDCKPQYDIPIITFFKMLFTVLIENKNAREALGEAIKKKYNL